MGCSKELINAIISDYYKTSLSKSCELHQTSTRSFFHALSTIPEYEQIFIQAQQSKAELFMDEIIGIADDPAIDPLRARNMIVVRQSFAAKMRPLKFGDRLDVNLTQTVDIRGALEAAKSRIREVMQIPESQGVGTSDGIQSSMTGCEPVKTVMTVINDLDELLA